MVPAFVTLAPLRTSALATRSQSPCLHPRRSHRRPFTLRPPRAQSPSDPTSAPISASQNQSKSSPPSSSSSSSSSSSNSSSSNSSSTNSSSANSSSSIPASSSTPAPSSSTHPSEFRHRFDDLRGKDIEPVAVTLQRFNSSFMRPVPIVYRSVINEMLTTSHLAKVCAMWRFDAIFAYGFDSIFSTFLRYYPNEEERLYLYKCSADALELDLNQIKTLAAAVADWVEGKTQDDIFSAVKAASPGATDQSVGPVVEACAYIRDAGDFDWYYSRLFGIGLIQIMDAVGAELTVTSAETWADAIGLEKSKFTSEMGAYLSSMERLKQAEQIFAEATAREAKKTAERLAAKAAAATKEAEDLEKQGDDDSDIISKAPEDEVKDESST